MNRKFLAESANTETQSQPAHQQVLAPQTGAQFASERSLSQALAGAFPEWDLLPATPFVRRVK
mgnify:CR=1 FL=1|jgi:hypothetical protein